MRKNTSLSGARTHESIMSSMQKFFVHFLVQLKTAKSPFEIDWPLTLTAYRGNATVDF